MGESYLATINTEEWKRAPRHFQYLREFVNRVEELNQFRQSMQCQVEDRKRILAYYGPVGIGKTMLLDRIELECNRTGIPCVRVVLEKGRLNSPIDIMNHLADELIKCGTDCFLGWQEVYLYWYSPLEMKVSLSGQQGARIAADQIHVEGGGDFVGGNIIEFHNSPITISTRVAITPLAAETALSETFLKSLSLFVQRRSLVLLFEGIDHDLFPPTTRAWLLDYLLDKTRDLGGEGVLPIISMIDAPKFDRMLDIDLYKRRLRPLTKEHIIEYFHLRKVPIPEEMVEDAALVCFENTRGFPLDVLNHVNQLLELLEGDALDGQDA